MVLAHPDERLHLGGAPAQLGRLHAAHVHLLQLHPVAGVQRRLAHRLGRRQLRAAPFVPQQHPQRQ